MNKKTKSVAKDVMKKTKVLAGKANKKAGQAMKSIQKEWKKEQPHREKYGEELKAAADKIITGGVKIGTDVVNTIKKNIDEINNQKKR